RDVEPGCLDGICPTRDLHICFPSAHLAELEHDVGVQQEHQVRSAGRILISRRGGSNSMSSLPGMAKASAMLPWRRARRWYSSMVISTCAGRPRSVMNTGPFFAAFLARLV